MKSDAKREHRIAMEIIADRAISPVYKGDEVEILGMAPERECEHEMFVETHWGRRNLAIPLAQVSSVPTFFRGERAESARNPGLNGGAVA